MARIPTRRRALARQDEPIVESDAVAVAHLVSGAEPDPDWARLVLDAHAEGWAAVGPALVARVEGVANAGAPRGRSAPGRPAAAILASTGPSCSPLSSSGSSRP